MFDRISAATDGRRIRAWKLVILAVLLGAAFALSGDTSRAQPDVDVSVTDTEITLSWDVRGKVVFYWHPAAGGRTKLETISGKSHTISALQPDTRYRFFFFQGVEGELFVTTLANPPAPSQDHSALVAQVTSWRNDSRYVHDKAHTDRWDRVLLTLGEPVSDSSLTRMSAAEAQTYVDRGWQRWIGVTTTLTELEQTDPMPTGTPELSIAAGPDVLEGETLTFAVTASPPPTSPLTVDLGIDTTGDFTVWDGTRTITIPLSGTFDLRMSSSDDGVDEPNGAVTATISTGTGYTISSSAGTATVTIQDDDDPPLPQVGISSAPASVTEGENIELTVTSTPAPASDLDVTLNVNGNGDFGVAPSSQTVTIPTSGSATVTLSTTDDDVDEEDGYVTVWIVAGTGYDIELATNARIVTIQDDDLKFAQQQSQQVTIPDVVITGGGGDIDEGKSDTYQIALSADPGSGVTITVTPSSSDPTTLSVGAPVTFTTDDWSTPKTITVNAGFDDDEDDGTVIVSHTVQGLAGITAPAHLSYEVADHVRLFINLNPKTITIYEDVAGNVGGGQTLVTLSKYPAKAESDREPHRLSFIVLTPTFVNPSDASKLNILTSSLTIRNSGNNWISTSWLKQDLLVEPIADNDDLDETIEITFTATADGKPVHMGTPPILTVTVHEEYPTDGGDSTPCDGTYNYDGNNQPIVGNKLPMVSLHKHWDVDEGETLWFYHTLTACEPLTGPTARSHVGGKIKIQIVEGADHLNESQTMFVWSPTLTARYFLTEENARYEGDQAITARLVPTDYYRIDPDNATATLIFRDNEGPKRDEHAALVDRLIKLHYCCNFSSYDPVREPDGDSSKKAPFRLVWITKALNTFETSFWRVRPHDTTTITAADARSYIDDAGTRHNPRTLAFWKSVWTDVATALDKIEAEAAKQQQSQPDNSPATPTISLDQNSDCSNNDADADRDSDVTTYDVDEDAKLSFTICSTGANFTGPVKLRVVQGKSVVKGEDPDGTHTVRPHKPTSGPTVTIPEGSIPSGGQFKAVFDVEVATATSNTSETLEYTIDEARYDQPDTTVQVIVLDGDGYTVGSQKLLTITIKDNDDPPAGFTSCLGNRVSGRDFTSWQAELFRNTLTQYKEDNDRWLRVLLALGEDKADVPGSALLTPMTSAEIQNLGLMTRPRDNPNFQLPENIWWTRAYNTLKKLEECEAAQQSPKQGQTQDQQPQVTPTISLDQNSDCSNNDADADGDSDVTTYDVDEDTNLAFTICATGANLPSKVKLRISRGTLPDSPEGPDGTHYIVAVQPLSQQKITSLGVVSSGKYKVVHTIRVATNTGETSETLQYKFKRNLYDQPYSRLLVEVLSGAGYTVGSQKLLTMTVRDNDDPPTGLGSCYGDRVSGNDFTSWQAAAYRSISTQFTGDYARWTRVILALGEAPEDVEGSSGLVAMTSQEIHDLGLMSRTTNLHNGRVAENGWWTDAYNALKKLEECAAAQQAPKQDSTPDPQPQTAPDSQVPATPTISLEQNSDCSNNDADADGDSDVTTYDVDEDATLSFTLCATGANLPSAVKLRMISGKEDVIGEEADGTHQLTATSPSTKQKISRSSFVVAFRHKITQDLTVATNSNEMSETVEYKLGRTRYDQADSTVIIAVLDGDGYTVGSQKRITITIKDNDEPPAVFSSCFPNLRTGGIFSPWRAEWYRNVHTKFTSDNNQWKRVLLALGKTKAEVPGSASLTPITSAEIESAGLMSRTDDQQDYFVLENLMWTEAYNALKKMEECNAPSTQNAQQSQADQDALSFSAATQQDAQPDPTPAKRTYDSSKTLMENCETNLVTDSGLDSMFTLQTYMNSKVLYPSAAGKLFWKRARAAFGDTTLAADVIPMTAAEAQEMKKQFKPPPKTGRDHTHAGRSQFEWYQMHYIDNTIRMLNECAANDFTNPFEPKVSITGGPDIHSGEAATFTITAFPAPTETLMVPVSLVTETGTVLPYPHVSVDASGVGSFTISLSDHSTVVTAFLGTGTGYSLRDPSTNQATVNIVPAGGTLNGRVPTLSVTKVTVNGVATSDRELTVDPDDTVEVTVAADIAFTSDAYVGYDITLAAIRDLSISLVDLWPITNIWGGSNVTGRQVLRKGLNIHHLDITNFVVRFNVDGTLPSWAGGSVRFFVTGDFDYLVDLDAREVVINVRPSSP